MFGCTLPLEIRFCCGAQSNIYFLTLLLLQLRIITSVTFDVMSGCFYNFLSILFIRTINRAYLEFQLSTFLFDPARKILSQVVNGLLYLHSHGILHRDLTLANLLLTKDMNVVSNVKTFVSMISPLTAQLTRRQY